MQKQEPNLNEIEKLLRIHSLKLGMLAYERDLGKQYLWREWLKAATTIIAFLGVASTMIWTLIQSIETKKVKNEEDRAKRFESAISRLGSKEANSRLTGMAGLSQFIKAADPKYQADAWNSLVQAIAVEDDVLVRSTLLESLSSLAVSQATLNDSLATIVRLNRSLAASLINTAAGESRLPSEPLTHSERLLAMADLISILVNRGAKSKDFAGIYCVGCDLRKITGDHITFHTALLDSADFRGVVLSAADFSDASLLGTDFSYARLQNANFTNANNKPFFWYQSFGGDPNPLPSFWCADLSGSTLDGFLIFGLNVAKEGRAWNSSPMPGGRWFFGAKMTGVKINDLYEYATSAQGRPSTTTEFDEDSEITFKDIKGYTRWIGFRMIGHRESDDINDLAFWDSLAVKVFNDVGDASGAHLPEEVWRVIPNSASAGAIAETCKKQ